MRLGTFSPSLLLRLARDTGVLARWELRVEEVAVRSSPEQFAALRDGALDAALTSPDNVLAYRFLAGNPLGETFDVRIVAGVDRGLGLALFARPEITEPDALAGQRIGVDVAASGFSFALFELLGRAGLRRDVDYTVVELGATPRRLTALRSGGCAATMLNADSGLRARGEGMRRLVRVVDVVRPYLGTVLAVAGPPTAEVRRLAGALQETARRLLSTGPADPDAEASDVTEVAGATGALTGLPTELAAAYGRLLLDPDEGLIADGGVPGLESVMDLRRHHDPSAALPPRDEMYGGALLDLAGLDGGAGPHPGGHP